MIRAFGFCNDTWDPASPGRLCRGRERWIEDEGEVRPITLYRTVVSGAVFSDDSARDARRGFSFSGVSAGTLLHALFPRSRVYGYCEAGDPRALPTERLVEEDWTAPVAGGQRQVSAVRWLAMARVDEVDTWIAGEKDGLAAPLADVLVIVDRPEIPKLTEALFRLVGYADPNDRPARKYTAGAVPEVLEQARAVVLLHLDKHGPVLAIYTNQPLDSDGTLDLTARAAGAFPVPFAIPPMLARWDRALFELRMDWDPAADGEFPVPPADDAGGRWSSRRRQFEEEREPEPAAEE